MESANLRQAVISGLRWSAVSRLLVQVLTWAVTVLVIRLVTPEDYGLAAIAGLFSSYLALINEFGLGVALIQKRVTDVGTLRRVFGFLLLCGAFFCLTM